MDAKNLIKTVCIVSTMFLTVACGQGYKAQTEGDGSITALSSLDLTDAGNVPRNCGPGLLCIADKKIEFKNEIGNAVAFTVSSVQSDGFTTNFVTPAGRQMTLNFKVQGDSLGVSSPAGMRPQFCFNHALANPCELVSTFGSPGYNCESALIYSGDFNGSTLSQKVTCPN